ESDCFFQLTAHGLVIDTIFQLFITKFPSFHVAVEFRLNPIDHVVKVFVPRDRVDSFTPLSLAVLAISVSTHSRPRSRASDDMLAVSNVHKNTTTTQEKGPVALVGGPGVKPGFAASDDAVLFGYTTTLEKARWESNL